MPKCSSSSLMDQFCLSLDGALRHQFPDLAGEHNCRQSRRLYSLVVLESFLDQHPHPNRHVHYDLHCLKILWNKNSGLHIMVWKHHLYRNLDTNSCRQLLPNVDRYCFSRGSRFQIEVHAHLKRLRHQLHFSGVLVFHLFLFRLDRCGSFFLGLLQ